MDPKQHAEMFYRSLAAADAVSCQLLARAARLQRGRVAALERQIKELQANNGTKEQLARLEAEAARRGQLAKTFDALDVVIDEAIEERATLDEKKFK